MLLMENYEGTAKYKESIQKIHPINKRNKNNKVLKTKNGGNMSIHPNTCFWFEEKSIHPMIKREV